MCVGTRSFSNYINRVGDPPTEVGQYIVFYNPGVIQQYPCHHAVHAVHNCVIILLYNTYRVD